MRKKTIPFTGKMHIKNGDTVMVMAGKDKGKSGKVTRVYPKTGKLVVEGLNMVTKHTKGQPTASNPNPESGRLQSEAAILASKVSLMNADGQPTRIRLQTDENGVKTRVAVKGGAAIVEPPKVVTAK